MGFISLDLVSMILVLPVGGLCFAIDDPMVTNAAGKWLEAGSGYLIHEALAFVEIAGKVYENVTILRNKAWTFATLQGNVVIGGMLHRQMAVSFIGAELLPSELSQLPPIMRSPGQMIVHNGESQFKWISMFLARFPLRNGLDVRLLSAHI